MADQASAPLSVLAYGDSNTWGAVPQPYRGAGGRFGVTQRWPARRAGGARPRRNCLRRGLNGRTTRVDDPIEGEIRNGERYLPVSLITTCRSTW